MLYVATSTFFSIEVRMYGCSSGEHQVVLVGVDADGPHLAGLAGGGGGFEGAETGTTCSRVHDVSAGLVLGGGEFLALGRVVEAAEVRRLADVVGEDLDVRVDGLGASGVAGFELLDEFVLDATDESDGARLALQCRSGTDEERALLFGEHERCHVGASTTESTMAKLVSGAAAAAAVIESPNRKPTPMHEAVAVVDEPGEALGAVAVAGRGRLGTDDAESRRPPCRGRRPRRR